MIAMLLASMLSFSPECKRFCEQPSKPQPTWAQRGTGITCHMCEKRAATAALIHRHDECVVKCKTVKCKKDCGKPAKTKTKGAK